MVRFTLKGVCPVCGKEFIDFNPPLSLNLNSEVAEREERRKQKHPVTFYKCYHNGTSHHSNEFKASSGCRVPMHLFWTESNDRVYPTAGDK